MSLTFPYHESLAHLHVGCERPHAYFIPYHTSAAAKEGNRALSDRFISLCGEWSFHYYKALYEVPDFTADTYTGEGGDRLTVPMNWQVALNRGYDLPHYINIEYPFPVDVPHVPVDNPCGLYEREFYMDAETIETRRVHLNFEGVDSCFYLYINNRFVAYSQVSHMTSEIVLNDYLVAGKNNIKVLVLKWCDGTYLEAQDKIRLSGIFREVYLLLRDPVHITDIYARAEPNEDFSAATVTAELSSNGAVEVDYRLVCPCGATVAEGKATVNGEGTISISVPSPKLWSDETPDLYELYLCAGTEVIRVELGVRRFEVKGKVVYVNGKKVKAKGMNRHDSHPELGYATPLDHMLRDLYLLKAHNINFIRTSHYPNDPRFLELCDRLGFYVCDETDIETHGMQCAGNWDELTDNPEWSEAFLDRSRLMMERDKNHASVLMWSVGNESGTGLNHRLQSEYFHERMPGCIVHCEDASRRFFGKYARAEKAEDRKKVNCDYNDLESRMYLSYEECLTEHLDNPYSKKPLFLCEYSHAMGNSNGDLEGYWQLIYKYDSFFGGCVWELTDHTVNIGTHADPKYIYGGDMGHKYHWGNFCVDGSVYPDRRPHTGLLEYKQVIRPCRAIAFDQATGTVTLKSYRHFTSLEDLDLYWSIERNGKVLRTGQVRSLRVRPGYKRDYVLDLGDLSALDGFCYLNLSYRTNIPHPWAEIGYEVGQEQFALECPAMPRLSATSVQGEFSVCEDAHTVTVTDGSDRYVIDRHHGVLCSIAGNGKEMLQTPVVPHLWRAPTDNDRIVKRDWAKFGYDRMMHDCYGCEVTENTPERIAVTATLTMGAVTYRTHLKLQVVYSFAPGEGVTVATHLERPVDQAPLPRFGFVFQMPAGNEQLRYFGKGPVESYIDKCHASKMGLYTTTVTDHFEPYVRPQENMAHIETRWMEVADLAGQGILATGANESAAFSFNCSHYTDEQLTEVAHDYELVPMEETVVHIDYRHAGIGSASCGRPLEEKFRLNPAQLDFAFRLQPVFINNTCPFEKAVQ